MAPCYCSFVYAFNEHKAREALWSELCQFSTCYKGPWVIMGDMNCVMEMDGSTVRLHEVTAIISCMSTCGMKDILHMEVFSKLDRANDEWMDTYERATAFFLRGLKIIVRPF